MEPLLKCAQDGLIEKKDFPDFSADDIITVYCEIREGDKERTQSFKGIVIQRKGHGVTATFTIRRMSGIVGVKRIFSVNIPAPQKIEVNKKGRVRRTRICYLGGLTGKEARIKEVR